MNELRATNWILLWIALMIFNKFYPDTARTYWYFGIAIAVIYWSYSAWKTWTRDQAEREQEQKELKKNNKFMTELDGIRKRYDPKHEWNEATILPADYQREVDELRSRFGIVD
jgi:hypothetical protein